LGRECPWCCEPLPRSARSAADCPMCGRQLRDEAGRELSRLDLRYEGLRDSQERRFRGLLTYGSVVAAVLGLAIGFMHLAAVVCVPMMVVAHLLVARVFLVRESLRLMGPKRRFFSRWIVRLSILWGGAVGYGMAVIPIAGSLFSTATFAGLTWLVHHYTLWGLEREWARRGTAVWEKVVLGGLVFLTVTATVVVIVIAALAGWTGAYVLDLVRGH